MPRETRWFIKVSLASLVLASILGTVHFGWPALFESASPVWVRNLHVHLATVGWLVNMVLGVALWMFPMPSGSFRTGQARYPRGMAVACFFALNAGLALRFVAEPMGDAQLGMICGALQIVGILLGVIVLWPRVRAVVVQPPARGGADAG